MCSDIVLLYFKEKNIFQRKIDYLAVNLNLE